MCACVKCGTLSTLQSKKENKKRDNYIWEEDRENSLITREASTDVVYVMNPFLSSVVDLETLSHQILYIALKDPRAEMSAGHST